MPSSDLLDERLSQLYLKSEVSKKMQGTYISRFLFRLQVSYSVSHHFLPARPSHPTSKSVEQGGDSDPRSDAAKSHKIKALDPAAEELGGAEIGPAKG